MVLNLLLVLSHIPVRLGENEIFSNRRIYVYKMEAGIGNYSQQLIKRLNVRANAKN